MQGDGKNAGPGERERGGYADPPYRLVEALELAPRIRRWHGGFSRCIAYAAPEVANYPGLGGAEHRAQG
jgi:hypothetical protein